MSFEKKFFDQKDQERRVEKAREKGSIEGFLEEIEGQIQSLGNLNFDKNLSFSERRDRLFKSLKKISNNEELRDLLERTNGIKPLEENINRLQENIELLKILTGQAGRRLLEKPTKEDLHFIIENKHLSFLYLYLKEKAAEILLKQNPTNEDLSSIIKNVPPLREKAAEILLKQNPTEKDLLFITWNCSPSLRKKAQELLIKMGH